MFSTIENKLHNDFLAGDKAIYPETLDEMTTLLQAIRDHGLHQLAHEPVKKNLHGLHLTKPAFISKLTKTMMIFLTMKLSVIICQLLLCH